MVNFIKSLISIIVIVFLCQISYASEKKSVTILTPKNMSFAITEVIRDYSRNSHTVVTGSFNSLKILINDIEEGYPADIIITDHPHWIKYLKQRGLVNISSITNFVEDRLVMITNKNYYDFNKEILQDVTLSDDETKRKFYNNFIIAIADDNTNLTGAYAEEVIKNSKIFSAQSNIIKSNDVNKFVLDEENVIGITNYTNTYDNPNINILESFDQKLYPRYIYQIAVIASENMEEAENFIKFLKSKKTLNVLRKYGFEVIE